MDSGKCVGGAISGGLEETYTDFDAWVTRRSWCHRHRPYQRGEEIPNRRAFGIDLQDSLVNGLSFRKPMLTPEPTEKDLMRLTRLCKNGNESHFDFVLLRLVRENGRRRLLLINRSKL